MVVLIPWHGQSVQYMDMGDSGGQTKHSGEIHVSAIGRYCTCAEIVSAEEHGRLWEGTDSACRVGHPDRGNGERW